MTMPSKTRTAGISFLSLLLAGCMTVGPNYKPPTPPASHGYDQPGDIANKGELKTDVGAQVVGDWWTLFQFPALDTLMRQAIANNLTLEQARAHLAEANYAEKAQGGPAHRGRDGELQARARQPDRLFRRRLLAQRLPRLPHQP